ncbi:hypothetical protein D3C84_641140 [compost metagenome]
MLAGMHNGLALRPDLDPAADPDVAAVIGHQADGGGGDEHLAFGRRQVQVLLRVEHHVVVLGLHPHLAAIGDGADALVLGEGADPFAGLQTHGRAAGQLQVVLGGGVVVFTGVMHLRARRSAGDAGFGRQRDHRLARTVAGRFGPLTQRLAQRLDALGVDLPTATGSGGLAEGLEQLAALGQEREQFFAVQL